MIKNDNSFFSIQTNITQNKEIINKNVNNFNKKKSNKKVSFNNNVVVINVESYKDYNKLYSYDEEDIYNNYIMKDEYQNHFENMINNNNNIAKKMGTPKQTKKENECCCNLF